MLQLQANQESAKRADADAGEDGKDDKVKPVPEEKLPMVTDIQQATHFFNSLTCMGSFFVAKDEQAYTEADEKKPLSNPVKSMSYFEKIQQVKNELKCLLDENDKEMCIMNSVYQADSLLMTRTYQGLRESLTRVVNSEKLAKKQVVPINTLTCNIGASPLVGLNSMPIMPVILP